MADYLGPSPIPIAPAAEAVKDRPYTGPRSQSRLRPPAAKAGPVEDREPEETEDDQLKHELDLDA
ncbi:MAG: hypothetical protein ACRD11_13215 [Terriglobia bacterium]